MLKNLMHSSHARTETGRPASPPYASAKPDARTAAAKPEPVDEGSKLIVGPNIKLKGAEITDCEILVVEGRVEASMNSRDIRIAEGGVFSGKAEIDVAEIRGTFEGELTARKRLVIYATGRVSGVIHYGALMVEEGGTLYGNVAYHTAGASVVKLPESATSTSADESADEAEAMQGGATLVRSLGKRHG
jgi:cytoskeletal protein CcmA (bactofilin family)